MLAVDTGKGDRHEKVSVYCTMPYNNYVTFCNGFCNRKRNANILSLFFVFFDIAIHKIMLAVDTGFNIRLRE